MAPIPASPTFSLDWLAIPLVVSKVHGDARATLDTQDIGPLTTGLGLSAERAVPMSEAALSLTQTH